MTNIAISAPKRSYKAAVVAMCKGCIYDPQAPGTWRKQVEECTATGCPLYPVRPVSNYRDSEGEK